jgi:hypothetical protein
MDVPAITCAARGGDAAVPDAIDTDASASMDGSPADGGCGCRTTGCSYARSTLPWLRAAIALTSDREHSPPSREHIVAATSRLQR